MPQFVQNLLMENSEQLESGLDISNDIEVNSTHCYNFFKRLKDFILSVLDL